MLLLRLIITDFCLFVRVGVATLEEKGRKERGGCQDYQGTRGFKGEMGCQDLRGLKGLQDHWGYQE